MKIDVNTGLQLLTALLTQANQLAVAVKTARAQGREDLTDEEVDSFVGSDDAARAKLQAQIDAL